MTKEKGTLDFILKKTDETRNSLLEETTHNNLMGRSIKTCVGFKLLLRFFIFVSAVSRCAVSAFASLDGVPTGIASSALALKIGAITARI